MKTNYTGDILSVRAVEDCIRITRKYTKGAFHKSSTDPIQGDDFSSKVLTEYYEVYPDMELSWDMLASDAWAWIWGDTSHIDIFFRYNYTTNKAKMTIHGGTGVIRDLIKGIPELGDKLLGVTLNQHNNGNQG